MPNAYGAFETVAAVNEDGVWMTGDKVLETAGNRPPDFALLESSKQFFATGADPITMPNAYGAFETVAAVNEDGVWMTGDKVLETAGNRPPDFALLESSPCG